MQLHDALRLSAGAVSLLLVVLFTLARRRAARNGWRRLFAAMQISLATLLVICAGLLARSAVQLRGLDPGVAAGTARRAVLAFRTDRYGTPERRRAFFDRVLTNLRHVPGLRMDDSGGAQPLAGNTYFAVFFSMGDAPPVLAARDAPPFVVWTADVDPESLAVEVKSAVKTLDRGIHYLDVGYSSTMGRVTRAAFGTYATFALLLVYVGFRRDAPRSVFPPVVVGIALGLALASFLTVLLTGYLFGISVTDFGAYALSVALVAAAALSAPLISSRREHETSQPAC
jgi:hypothetical protein